MSWDTIILAIILVIALAYVMNRYVLGKHKKQLGCHSGCGCCASGQPKKGCAFNSPKKQ